MLRFIIVALFTSWAVAAQPPSPDDLARLRERNATLALRIRSLEAAGQPADLVADVAIYEKAADWLLRYPEEFFAPDYYAKAMAGVERGLARADELARGSHAWTAQRGRLSRGYRSRIDGSVQPYGLAIPAAYDPAQPIRLDVVLHGRNGKLTEATFLAAHDVATPVAAPQQAIQLEVYGRGNNSYFWAGETDVMEALDSVRARYRIDPERIVLRGFSMGGTGAWELGLHRPTMWAAVEAGAGYVETREMVREGIKDPRHLAALTIHNSILCVRNLTDVAFVGYGGEIDPQLISVRRVREELGKLALASEELRTLFLIGPKTGHRFHPDSKKESDAFLDAALPRRMPEHFRFAAYTPHFGTVWDFHLDTLENLYQPALLEGSRDNVTTSNVAVLTLDRARALTIDGQRLEGAAFEKKGGAWKAGVTPGLRKRAGLQGPIDDAFQQAFLCVKPAAGSSPVLDDFRKEFAKYMRGDVRIKTPAEVTAADIANANLALFGDPWTNPLIAKVLPKLPVKWSKERIEIGRQSFPAAGRRVVMIYPNPLAPEHYVVLNSGHTFSGPDGYVLASWLLYPRLGDYAVINDATGAVETFGYFDKNWQIP